VSPRVKAHRKLRVLLLNHPALAAPDAAGDASEEEAAVWKTEYDVTATLRRLGHEVLKLHVQDELQPIRAAVEDWKPHVVFNLLEEFAGLAVFDQHVVSYLELLGAPYTGCNPRGLMLARGKGLAKTLVGYHRIRTPGFAVFPRGRKARRPRALAFPLIVKSLTEEASLGIAQASVVDDAATASACLHPRELAGRARRALHRGPFFVASRQRRPRCFRLELASTRSPRRSAIATARASTTSSQEKAACERQAEASRPSPGIQRSRRIYRILELTATPASTGGCATTASSTSSRRTRTRRSRASRSSRAPPRPRASPTRR
jgi:hypothetical protein